MTDPAPIAAAKATARRAARASRAGLDPTLAALLPAHWPPAWTAAAPISAYWPMRDEIDPRPLLAQLAAGGAALALPWMENTQTPPLFRAWAPGDPLAPDGCNIPAPLPGAAPITPRLLLVPLLAFDRDGYRLGYGGGHYDRVIATLRPAGTLAVGLAFAGQEVETVPRGPHDQRLDAVLCETGVRWFK
jgi:5-formyltetrahydrofolate cyclo-ligase